MIKDKIFKNCENVTYEDIWLYKIDFEDNKNKTYS